MDVETALNDFAVRSFRDTADADYIAARLVLRAGLVSQFLWASQQATEKYLKCILLLHRIPAVHVRHDLGKALSLIASSGILTLKLTQGTTEFIKRLDQQGRFRYFEVSTFVFSTELINLDRAVWELRRYCTLAGWPRLVMLRSGQPAPRVRIPGGYLEKVIADAKSPAREALLWQNGFFGERVRRVVRLRNWFQAKNAPLSLYPEILNEVLKYVRLPKDVQTAYHAHKEAQKLH